MPVWELLLQEMHKPRRQVRWEHVLAQVNVYGNEVANGLAVEGTCSNPLWSRNVKQDSKFRVYSGSVWGIGFVHGRNDLGRVGPTAMDNEELTGEASGIASTGGLHADNGS